MSDPLDFLDPDCKPIVARLAAGRDRRRSGLVSPAEMREKVKEIFRPWNAGGPSLPRIETFSLPGATGARQVRRYVPTTATGPKPSLFYMHGGGWIIGDLDTEDRYLRELALSSGVQIFSLDYALAPEHKFPLPLGDCENLIGAALIHASDLEIDVARIGLGGSSAGANLAVAAGMVLRDRGVTTQALLLNCGAFVTSSTASKADAADDAGPSRADMEYFLAQYLSDMALRTDARVDVASADLRRLPRAKLIAAGIDSLRDDSVALAQRLCQCGVSSELSLYPGLIHGFMSMVSEVAAARHAIVEAADFLRRCLVGPPN